MDTASILLPVSINQLALAGYKVIVYAFILYRQLDIPKLLRHALKQLQLYILCYLHVSTYKATSKAWSGNTKTKILVVVTRAYCTQACGYSRKKTNPFDPVYSVSGSSSKIEFRLDRMQDKYIDIKYFSAWKTFYIKI